MNTLIIDTTYSSCSIVIVNADMNSNLTFNNSNNQQSETITEVLLTTLTKAKKELREISNIIVTNGPGNFTSIRVGVSFALGIAKGICVPLYSLSSLKLLSIFNEKNSFFNKKLISVMPSRGNEIFVQEFSDSSLSDSEILKIKNLDLEKEFSPDKYYISFCSFQKEVLNLFDYDFVEREFEDMSLNLVSKFKKKKINLTELKNINYFSEPSAEKVNSSWLMKHKK